MRDNQESRYPDRHTLGFLDGIKESIKELGSMAAEYFRIAQDQRNSGDQDKADETTAFGRACAAAITPLELRLRDIGPISSEGATTSDSVPPILKSNLADSERCACARTPKLLVQVPPRQEPSFPQYLWCPGCGWLAERVNPGASARWFKPQVADGSRKGGVRHMLAKVGFDFLGPYVEDQEKRGWEVVSIAQSGDDSQGRGWLYLVVMKRCTRATP